MPISGLVITLAEDTALQQAALTELNRHAAIDVGPLTGRRLPIIVETLDTDADREIWEWLHALPGIVLVNVAAVHFTESHTGELQDAECCGHLPDETELDALVTPPQGNGL